MNEEILHARETLLKEQLKIVQLERKKIIFQNEQNHSKVQSIQEQIDETKHNFQETIIPYWRSFMEQNPNDLELTELLFALAPIESKFRKIILETELLEKNKLLKKENLFEISEPKTKIEQIRQKNQLLQIFIQMELIFRQWTEYYHFQKENITAFAYTDLVKYKYQAFDRFPELQSVHCFYGSYNEIINQLKTRFSKRNSMFNPILIILVQYGTRNGEAVSQEQQLFISEQLDEYFQDVVKYHDGKMKNLGDVDEMMIYITIK